MPISKPSSLTIALIVGFVVVTVVALTLGVTSLARASNLPSIPGASQQTGIAVCGHGTAQLKPDQAQLNVGVQASAANADDARAQAAQAMNNVIAALKSNGVDDKDIQTGYFAIQPQYDYGSGKQQQIGYIAVNSVSVTIRKVGDASKIVDAVTAAGGNNVIVNGIQFTASDPSQAQDQAVQNALADAKRQADLIAKAAGVSDGTPISIQVGACGSTTVQTYQDASGKGAAPAPGNPTTPIQPGQNTIEVYVGVVYSIK